MGNSKMWEQFETSLSSASLVKLVEEMKDKGLSQLEIYNQFGDFRAMLREAGREKDEDSVLDILDRIAGWCGPEAKLFNQAITNEEIEAYHKLKNMDK